MAQCNFSIVRLATGLEILLVPVEFSMARTIRHPLISNPDYAVEIHLFQFYSIPQS
jgi:hypothetical protein